MKSSPVSLKLAGRSIVAGMLTYQSSGRESRSFFEYDSNFLRSADAFALDPKQLPLRPGRQVTPDGFELFNGFRDASPDGWGRLVLGKTAGQPLDEFDLLLAAGADRVGALAFGPEREPTSAVNTYLDFDGLADLLAFFADPEVLDERWREHLLRGSSLGGARPKATVLHEGRLWLAKFSRRSDRVDVVRSEYATMRLAKAAGLDVPEVRVVDVLGTGVYLIERFDRVARGANFECLPFLSALSMLGAHEMEAHRYSYADVAAEIRAEGVNVRTTSRELFRRAAFNILVNNTDDHLRNHGFLRTPHGWVLAPLYDVVPFPEVGTDRFLALRLGPEGRKATLANLLGSANAFGLKVDDAREDCERMCEQVLGWRGFFESCGVSGQDLELLATAFRDPSILWAP
jgi:serine/threonine-protein kinase HipA